MDKTQQNPSLAPSLTAGDWETFTRKGNKVQRKALRALKHLLIEAGISPDGLDQKLFEKHVFPHHTDCDSADEPTSRGRVNSFMRAFNAIGVTFPMPMQVLSGIAGPMDIQAAAKRTFAERFDDDLATYFGHREIADKARSGDLNGLFNATCALEENGVAVANLQDLIIEQNIEIIRDNLDERGQKGAHVQVISVLAHLAAQAGDQDCRQDLLDSINGMKTKSEINTDNEDLLLPYVGKIGLPKIVKPILEIAIGAKDFDIEATRSQANTISSAICILIMIFAPATFDTIYNARFVGEAYSTKRGLRPTLALPQYNDSIEAPLNKKLRNLIDKIYFRYVDAGVRPEGLMMNPDGSCRSKGNSIASIEAILAEKEIKLTPLQLRDLGVAQALWRGKSPEDMARAARMGRGAMKDRFSNLVLTIQKVKNLGNREL